TMETHWGKHHRKYVDTVNEKTKGTELENASLEQIVQRATGPLLNSAAQAWNHAFLWKSMTPDRTKLGRELGAAIHASFGSTSALEKKFKSEAVSLFGSGWVWLARSADGGLSVVATPNAALKIHDESLLPLAVMDVWEHAYYLDYKSERPKYVDGAYGFINWSFASDRYLHASMTQGHEAVMR
ncbi:MAG TPA: superoxide dismutase, partial [Myxococcota bacterium]